MKGIANFGHSVECTFNVLLTDHPAARLKIFLIKDVNRADFAIHLKISLQSSHEL